MSAEAPAEAERPAAEVGVLPTPSDLPRFPVVNIHDEDQALLASAPGATPVSLELTEQIKSCPVARNAAAADAAAKVADSLGVDNVRVDLFVGEHRHQMWLDRETHTLQQYQLTSGDAVASEGKRKKTRGKGLRVSKQSVALIVVIAVVVLSAGAIFGPKLLPGSAEPEANPAPGPAQLPVTAPAGWDTYADYAVNAADADPLVVGDQVIFARTNQIVQLDASSGVEVGHSELSFTPTRLRSTSGVGENVIVAEGSSSQVAIGTPAGPFHELHKPSDYAKLDFVSGVPVFTESGQVRVPDAHGRMSSYTLPADSEPAMVTDDGVWMVSTLEPQAWLIKGTSADLPAPVQLPSPQGGFEYEGLVAGVGDQIVLGFAGKDSSTDRRLEVMGLTEGEGATNPRTFTASSAGTEPVVDPARNIIVSHGTMLDVKTDQAMKVGASGRYGAGFFWMTDTVDGNAKRVSVTGDIKEWEVGTSAYSAVIPEAIDANGRAVVVYKPQTGERSAKLYMLRAEEE